jgi:tetratricopeptide (TPR) repeat protein
MTTPKDNTSEIDLIKRLNALMQEGYHLVDAHHEVVSASDVWLEAWEIVKSLSTPEIRGVASFDKCYPSLLQSIHNWSFDVEMHLHNAGIDEAAYHEHRIQFVHEYFELFPDDLTNDNRYLNFHRAIAEGLWNLGRHEEAEAAYKALVDHLPDEGWAYIGWADDYWIMFDSPRDYAKGESILQRALARPTLKDRTDVLDRLIQLYDEWDKPEQADVLARELEQLLKPPPVVQRLKTAMKAVKKEDLPRKKLGRNELCWCGSGKKYKHCHLRSDQKRTK